jgi:NCS1 family nucleobase:cation symporter-1
VQNRQYRVADIISSKIGIYGAFNVKAIAIYVAGIAIQVPFMEESFFHGPWASIAGGADVSWMVGLVATALIYYMLATKHDLRARGASSATAEAWK